MEKSPKPKKPKKSESVQQVDDYTLTFDEEKIKLTPVIATYDKPAPLDMDILVDMLDKIGFKRHISSASPSAIIMRL